MCDVEIIDKKLNLNGEAFGALLFGYVLGQQSKNTHMSTKNEEALAQKIGELETYKDKAEEHDEPIQEEIIDKPREVQEKSDYTNLLTEWKQLK